jgi:hypothetical protein
VQSWGLSATEQDEVWRRWRHGEWLRLIARRLGKRGRWSAPWCSRPVAYNSTPRAAGRAVEHDRTRIDQPQALDAIADELNGRPRQTLGFKTPSQILAEALR